MQQCTQLCNDTTTVLNTKIHKYTCLNSQTIQVLDLLGNTSNIPTLPAYVRCVVYDYHFSKSIKPQMYADNNNTQHIATATNNNIFLAVIFLVLLVVVLVIVVLMIVFVVGYFFCCCYYYTVRYNQKQ